MLFEVTPGTEPQTLNLAGTPDEITASADLDYSYVDYVAGYVVIKTGEAQHDGRPATRLTLADEMGQREVGRLVILNDAAHEERLEWIRWFEDETDAASFLEDWKNGAFVPAGYVQIPARAVVEGMVVREIEGFWDPSESRRPRLHRDETIVRVKLLPAPAGQEAHFPSGIMACWTYEPSGMEEYLDSDAVVTVKS